MKVIQKPIKKMTHAERLKKNMEYIKKVNGKGLERLSKL